MGSSRRIDTLYFAATAGDARGTLDDDEFVADGEVLTCSLCRGVSGVLFDLDRLAGEGLDPAIELPVDAFFGCLRCLRGGGFAFEHQTEAGRVRASGWQSGPLPFEDEDDPDRIAELTEVARRITPAALAELARTPIIQSIYYEEKWLVCCHDVMKFLGPWGRAELEARAVGDAAELFDRMCPRFAGAYEDLIDDYPVYAFECNHCGRLRG